MTKLEQVQAEYDAAIAEQKAAEKIVDSKTSKVNAARSRLIEAKREAAAAIPVDRMQRTLTDGSPVTDDHRDLKVNGQQKGYVVLSEAERAKGFVQPVRRTYVHTKCGAITTMGLALAETYARDPGFYSGTYCCGCGTHFTFGATDGDFVWDDGTKVGA